MAESGQSLRVFISYARRDCAAFAEELLKGLELAGFDPFLDRHDIAAGEDWEARLSGLIHSADTVVFAISPGAVGSERCAWEVEKAQALSKRIIPIVAIDVPEADTPEGLRRRNYIFFSEGHSFLNALTDLSKALRTDVEWIREHTRLGELAARWRARNKAEPMLLRGSELEGAKAWIAGWKAPSPEPTSLHREFIGESEAVELDRFSDERKRLEEVAAAQSAREITLKRFRLAVVVAVVLTGGLLIATAVMGSRALALRGQLQGLEAQLAKQTEEVFSLRAAALEKDQQERLEAGQEVAEVDDPVLQRLEQIRAELPAAAPERPAQTVRANVQLSPSFTLLELTHSETAERRGISNEPLPEHVENLRHTAQQLERVRTALNGAPILISSGYGTPELNRALGRAPTSEHLSGLAIDFRAPAFGSPYDVAAAIAASPELMAEIDQVYVEFNQWVHLSFGPRRRGQVLTMYRKPDDGRTYFLAGLHRLDRNGYLIDPPPEPAAAP